MRRDAPGRQAVRVNRDLVQRAVEGIQLRRGVLIVLRSQRQKRVVHSRPGELAVDPHAIQLAVDIPAPLAALSLEREHKMPPRVRRQRLRRRRRPSVALDAQPAAPGIHPDQQPALGAATQLEQRGVPARLRQRRLHPELDAEVAVERRRFREENHGGLARELGAALDDAVNLLRRRKRLVKRTVQDGPVGGDCSRIVVRVCGSVQQKCNQ